MWKQKVGISIESNDNTPINEVIKAAKEAGFDAISPVFTNLDLLHEIVTEAKVQNLSIQSLHAPFQKAADMWSKDENLSRVARAELESALDACERFHIPILVVHAWIGFEYHFDEAELLFQNFDEIVFYAKNHNVKIALENTEGEEYLFALMDHFKGDDTVGFCWDSGHEMCYNHSQDLLRKFGDRLLITHLNDNLGISDFDGKTIWTDDLHLLPFDGIADWEGNVKRLKKSSHLDVLNFELKIRSKPNRHENDIYEQMSIRRYFAEAYKRACKIAYMYSK